MNLNNYTEYDFPFYRIEIENCINYNLINEINHIIEKEMINKNTNYQGKRSDINNRKYISKNMLTNNIEIKKLINFLLKHDVINFFEKKGDIDLKDCYLRCEIMCDHKGYWLEKHKDISEKKVSMLIYINDNDEDLSNGTDLYNKNLELVHTIPFKHNLGYIFFPNEFTWHGLEKGKNIKNRKCLLINYVTFKTDFKL